MDVLQNLNLNGNQIKTFVVDNVTTSEQDSNKSAGRLLYNSNALKFWNSDAILRTLLTDESGSIQKGNLSSSVQTSLGLADTALQSVAFGDLTSHPTTIGGYGITDAYTKTQIDAKTITIAGTSVSLGGSISADTIVGAATAAATFAGLAAKATQLATARKIWGQDFDGTAPVSGDMSGVGKIDFNGKTTGETGLEIVVVGTQRYLHTTLPFYSDSSITAGGIGSGGGGGGGIIETVYGYADLEGTYSDSDKTNTFNAYTTARLAQRITALENAPEGGVTSVINLTGDITQSQLRTALGLGSLAYKSSLTDTDIPSLAISKITGLQTALDGKVLKSDLYDDNNKVKIAKLPDAILGQVLYGGTVNASGVCTLSANFKAKYGITSLTLTATNANDYEGAYFIASANGTSGVPSTLGVVTGDWIISDGTNWQKIDNTDAVTSVNGYTGAVTLSKSDVGLGNVENKSSATIRSEITASDIPALAISKITGLQDALDGKTAAKSYNTTSGQTTYTSSYDFADANVVAALYDTSGNMVVTDTQVVTSGGHYGVKVTFAQAPNVSYKLVVIGKLA